VTTIDLAGRRALVTGGNRGIGRAIAEALADAGANVAIFARSGESVEETAREIAGRGVESLALVGDVARLEDVDRAWSDVDDAWGGVEILVNNAGITRDGLLLRMKPEEWRQVLEVNLTGTYHWCRTVLRSMVRQRWGRIINLSSVVGLSGNAGQANYAASKAGVVGFSKSLAQEVASRGIHVNVIAPGFIETEMTAAMSAGARESFEDRIPLGRAGTAEDVARVALFLASPLGDYITGQVICVDGGLTM